MNKVKRDKVIKYYNSTCIYCGYKGDMTIEHIVPVSSGGTDHLRNLAAACKSCNSGKKNNSIEEFRLSESLKRSKFGRVINRQQYKALKDLKLIGEVKLIKFYYEVKQL